MKHNNKRNTAPLNEVKRFLKSGVTLREVSAITHYTKGEPNLMSKCWGIARGSGRRKQVTV